MHKTIAIIGGGISGLSTAYYLKKRIEEEGLDISLILLEKSDRLGGSIRTDLEDGFIFEGGPRGFLGVGRRTLELSYDLGIWDNLELSSDYARVRYLFDGGKLRPLKGFDLFSLLKARGVFSILGEFFRRSYRGEVDESVYDFISRRFSRDIMERFVELIITGIYAGDPKNLSARAIFPLLKEFEESSGSILKGLVKYRKARKAKDVKDASIFNSSVLSISKSKLISYKGGMQTLISALANYLSKEISFLSRIEKFTYAKRISIDYKSSGSSHRIEADKVFFALPSYELSNYLDGSVPSLSSLLASIDYASMSVICLGFRKRVHDYRGFGFLSSRREGLNMLGCIWNDLVFPSLAPSGMMSLTAMYGGACHPYMIDWDDKRLLSVLRSELKLSMGISAPWDICKIYRYKRGIPQYTIGHADKVKSILSSVKDMGNIFLVGNYLNGIGMNDCINRAYSVVSKCNLD